jgi:hypothetical protein
VSSNERDRRSGNGSLVVNVSEDIKNLTLHSALHTHQQGLEKYVATRPNRFCKRRILTDY